MGWFSGSEWFRGKFILGRVDEEYVEGAAPSIAGRG
jgi:hypothetical protein